MTTRMAVVITEMHGTGISSVGGREGRDGQIGYCAVCVERIDPGRHEGQGATHGSKPACGLTLCHT